jgi:FkbM family methyltransferase
VEKDTMSFRSRAIESVIATPLGRAVFKVVQPMIHKVRRMANPDVPIRNAIYEVDCLGKKIAIQHRRENASDLMAIDQCFTKKQYDMPIGAHGVLIDTIYKEIVASGRQPLIVDCGANIGCSVLWFNARYPEAHIVAIEPASDNFELLSANCAGLDVDLRQAGVAGADGYSYLKDTGGGGMAYRTEANGDGPEIAMVSIQTVLASKPAERYALFLLKVDIEGAEMGLFDENSETLAEFPLIILEPHDWMLPGQLSSREFFRFHVNAGREFCMKQENVASIAMHSSLLGMTKGLKN